MTLTFSACVTSHRSEAAIAFSLQYSHPWVKFLRACAVKHIKDACGLRAGLCGRERKGFLEEGNLCTQGGVIFGERALCVFLLPQEVVHNGTQLCLDVPLRGRGVKGWQQRRDTQMEDEVPGWYRRGMRGRRRGCSGRRKHGRRVKYE